MINLQKAQDIAETMMNVPKVGRYGTINWDISKKILRAIQEGHQGCISYNMDKAIQIHLEEEGFLVEQEFEEDNTYWIISWQEQVII